MNYIINQTKITFIAVIAAMFAMIPAKASAASESLAFFNAFLMPRFVTIHTETMVERTEYAEDALRAARLNEYFEKRDMPLAGYGAKFVEASKKCDIDWRLLPAIGVRESSGGKFEFNNNPFGWGSAKIKFEDFNEAIEVVTEHLCGQRESTARYYKDKNTMEKLWYYNGSVMPSYPKEVVEIMEMM